MQLQIARVKQCDSQEWYVVFSRTLAAPCPSSCQESRAYQTQPTGTRDTWECSWVVAMGTRASDSAATFLSVSLPLFHWACVFTLIHTRSLSLTHKCYSCVKWRRGKQNSCPYTPRTGLKFNLNTNPMAPPPICREGNTDMVSLQTRKGNYGRNLAV